jgi:signal transduction histidine kinase
VHGDRTLLTEAVVNLLDNAVKWTPSRGRLKVESGRTDDASFATVSDSGPGIPPSFRDRLFDRFSRDAAAAYKGSGLGLSIVSEVVRLHRGRVRVDAAPEGGAAFRLTFPAPRATSGIV